MGKEGKRREEGKDERKQGEARKQMSVERRRIGKRANKEKREG